MPTVTITGAGETTTVDYGATVVGARLADTTYAQSNPIIGPIQATRIFYQPGDAFPTTYVPPTGWPADVVPIVSYKQQNAVNRAAYARSLAAAGGMLCYHHEPEADYPSGAAFVAEWQAERDAVRGEAPTLPFGMIAGAFQYASNNAGYDGSFIPAAPDWLAIDTYLQGSTTLPNKIQPLATEPRFQRWLSFARTRGVPLGITEYGRGLTDTNQWDADRAAVIPQDRDYLHSLGFRWWLYWYTSGGTSKSWRFTDAASIAAWRAESQ